MAEVYYGGDWHLLDASLICYFRDTGGEIASVDEIVQSVQTWCASNGNCGNQTYLRQFMLGGGWLNVGSGSLSTIGGGERNLAQAMYATIAGGGPSDPGDRTNTNNRVFDDWGTIGGGGYNRVGGDDADTGGSGVVFRLERGQRGDADVPPEKTGDAVAIGNEVGFLEDIDVDERAVEENRNSTLQFITCPPQIL